MAKNTHQVFVFGFLAEKNVFRFVPAGRLTLTETPTANPLHKEIASEFSYGTKYLQRPEAFELDPVSLSLANPEAVRNVALFPQNGLGEFGGIRDAAPDGWGRRVIEARRKVPANSLPEAVYLLEAGGDRVGALDVRTTATSQDSPSASSMQSLEYVIQAAEAVERGAPVPEKLLAYLGAGPSAGGARPKASVRETDGTLWLAKFPASGDRLDIAKAEACTLELARRCGMTVPDVKYIEIGVRPVMLIRRFDRYWTTPGVPLPQNTVLLNTLPGPGKVEARLPFVSGLTLVGCSELESPLKSYADLAAAVRKYAAPAKITTNCEELFQRMVFNIFVSNDDDHLRNHGFIKSPLIDGWELSPLYDVVPRPGFSSERKLHLEVGAQGKLATLDNAMTSFAAFTPSREKALALIRQVWGEVRQWKEIFEDLGAAADFIDKIESAFRNLNDIASPALANEIRKAAD